MPLAISTHTLLVVRTTLLQCNTHRTMIPWWQSSAAADRFNRFNAQFSDQFSEDEDSDDEEEYSSEEEDDSDDDDNDDEEDGGSILPSVLTFPSLLGPSRQVQIQREEDDEHSIGDDDVADDNNGEDDDSETEETTKYYSEDDLKSLKVDQLKAILRKKKMKLSGRKADLVARLVGKEVISNEDEDVAIDESEEGLSKLTVAQLKKRLRLNDLPVSGNKTELIERLMGREPPKLETWNKSKAKQMLKNMFADDNSKVHTLSAEAIHQSHPRFKVYPFDKFQGYLQTIKAASNELKEINRVTEREVWEDIQHNPRPDMTFHGYPFWDTHSGRDLLYEDVKTGKAYSMKPMELQTTQPAYKEYPSKVFGKRVHQMKRFVREEPGWVAKRNKKAQKMHEAEVKSMKEDWDSQHVENDIDYICGKLEEVFKPDN